MSVVVKRLEFSFRPLFFEVRDEDVTSPAPPPPPAPQSLKIQLGGNGAQPMSIVVGGMTGSGPEPDGEPVGSPPK
jgi:hypothetical protein